MVQCCNGAMVQWCNTTRGAESLQSLLLLQDILLFHLENNAFLKKIHKTKHLLDNFTIFAL